MIGTKLAHYEITSHLGSGGMGDVYQATDSKLGRSVAIKLLPEAFEHDAERAARFEREARVLASLSHSNIAGIYGLEESGDRKFLVMELVSGETLAERIKRGPIPVDESLGIAKQICEALAAAHEKGIVHRDLKPANVKITPDGKVKVLDFGLAKAFEAEASKANLSQSPTLSMAATNAGVILGTASYMSPEQAKGQNVDKRTDIFALGCVFYEMLTGKQAFAGDTVGDILAAVIQREPDWKRLPADTPPSICRLLWRCLQKDRNRRFKEADDVRIEIEEARTDPFSLAVMPAASRTRERIAWALSAVFLIAMVALAFVHFREAPPEQPRVQFDVPLPGKSTNAIFEISPDGRYLAIVGFEGGRRQLWIRALDSGESRAMPGTENSNFPFWSPDSRYVGFFAGGKLKKVAVSGAAPQILCDTSNTNPQGGTWNQDGTILFGGSPAGGGLMRVSDAGGIPVAVTKASPGDAHNFPSFLSGESRFLFTIKSKPEDSGVYVASLDGMSPVRLLPDPSSASFVSKGSGTDGYLLFRRGTTLMAQPFDPIQLKLLGEMLPLAEQVNSNQNVAYGNFAVSRTGTLVFRSGAPGLVQQAIWTDRAGRRLKDAGKPGLISDMALSPDENRVALTISDPQTGNSDVWLLDVARGAMSRFTFGPGLINSPVWSPDGNRIAFSSRVSLFRDLYQRPVIGAGQQELLIHTTSGNAILHDWSSDGKLVVYSQDNEKTQRDLWLVPMDADHKSIPFLQSPFSEDEGQFSPDRRWMAYSSNESGQNQVYGRPISPNGLAVQISTTGGTKPRWRRDGRELFYLSPDNKLMAVQVKFGTSIEPGTPQALFEIAPVDYQPAADGQRFLVLAPAAEGAPAPMTVVLNWQSGLKK